MPVKPNYPQGERAFQPSLGIKSSSFDADGDAVGGPAPTAARRPHIVPEIVDKIAEMRAAQIAYFDRGPKGKHTQTQLQLCKALEREVDEWISLYRQARAEWEAFQLVEPKG